MPGSNSNLSTVDGQ
jgi:hypothetical protein